MSAIPYTVERRPDTGVNNVTLGMWLFLASEAMLFAGLFSAYFMLRAGAVEPWQPFRDHLGSAGLGTMVLMAASGALAWAAHGARTQAALPAFGGAVTFRLRLLVSVLLALSFCAVKINEYAAFYDQQLYPSANTQMAVYFLLTGVHLLHVAGGIVTNSWLLMTSSATWRDGAPKVVNRLEATALYWYFVDAVWLVVFVLIYVV